MMGKPMYKQRDGVAMISFDSGWRLLGHSSTDTYSYLAPNSTKADAMPPSGVWTDQNQLNEVNASIQVSQEAAIDHFQEAAFSYIAKQNTWNSQETLSGHGSELEATLTVRECLGQWITRYNIQVILDAPCGDG